MFKEGRGRGGKLCWEGEGDRRKVAAAGLSFKVTFSRVECQRLENEVVVGRGTRDGCVTGSSLSMRTALKSACDFAPGLHPRWRSRRGRVRRSTT